MKKINLLFLVFAIVLVSSFLVSAQDICCEQLKGDQGWCQFVPEEQCLTGGTPTSCDQTTYCQRGTCVEIESGVCSQNVPQKLCEEEKGGTWDPRSRAEISVCQAGCCIFGENTIFSTNTECLQLASDYGVDVDFNPSIGDEFSCLALANPGQKGACVFEEEFTKECIMGTKQECVTQGGDFNEGLLCTAPELETDCAPTELTSCEDDGRIYFLDSCRNLANVYDASKADDVNNYWKFMQEPECSGRNCGDCDYGLGGTMCREYDNGDYSTRGARPAMGDYVCADLGCEYNGERYEHGEKWCAETPGTLHNIQIASDSREYLDDTREILERDYEKYNLPGSEYLKLKCYDGEIIPEPCSPFRNEICVEFEYGEETGNFRGAECTTNFWRDCFNITNQESCEDINLDCKWVEGYRFDGLEVTTNDDRNSKEQGSCVPLFAPGFDFWNPESEDAALCSLGNVVENAVYEISWTRSRDTFEDTPTCDTSNDGTDGKIDAVQRCYDNCYLIPDYGREDENSDYMDIEKLMSIHQGGRVSGGFEDYCISDRRGYYCEGKTGAVGAVVGLFESSEAVNCARDEGKMKPFPIFFTHEEWLNSIRERARSIGDCGYKTDSLGEIYNSEESEIVAAIFQKLHQDGTVRDEDENAVTEIIYRGDETEVYGGEDGGYRGATDEE